MKTSPYKLLSILFASTISIATMAQSDTSTTKPFKEVYKTRETDRHLETEIKKKELQQAPSQIIVSKDSSVLKRAKKYKCRMKKK